VESTFLRSLEEKNGFKKKFFDFHQKFMTNGASTCRDTTQISKYHLLDLKTCQNTKAFALISGRVGDIL